MKRLISLLILLAFTYCEGQPITSRLNKIDSINSSSQANEFLHSLLGKDYDDYCIPDKLSYKDEQYKNFVSKAKAVSWVKADFDKNGYTDLLVITQDTTNAFESDGRFIVCILDSGNNRYFEKRLINFISDPAVASFRLTDGVPSILFFRLEHANYTYINSKGNKIPRKELVDTLIYKFDDFIEYNKTAAKFTIHKIQFETSMCFGTCPSFKITVNSDGTSEYEAKFYNEDRQGRAVEGNFKTKIDSVKLTEIYNLIDYINFPTLKNKYSVNWTDDQTGTLTITYNGNKIKLIRDYGQQGTFGLKRLYELLTALRLNQNWH